MAATQTAWVTEEQSPSVKLSLAVREILHEEQSEFQHIVVADSIQFGRMLILDGVFQTSIADEWVYSEMITHVPLCLHPQPRRILIVGGGDGGTAREVLRHTTVESVEMVEIDPAVIAIAKKYLPEIAAALLQDDPRLTVTVGDGIAKVEAAENEYDVIIVDCSDPIGPGKGLFTAEFYAACARALKADGIMVQQTESPFFHQQLIFDVQQAVAKSFPMTRLYTAPIPLYPSGYHSFTLGAKTRDPLASEWRTPSLPYCRYYNTEIGKAAFVLPEFVRHLVARDETPMTSSK